MATEAVNERGAGDRAGSGGDETAGRRRYDSPLRRQQAAQTRERILTAGSELVHEFTTWDWRGLTFRAVAERAGVGERTVYRYFATERELHDAIMRRLGEESGISYDHLSLDKIGVVTARLFAMLPSYAVMRWDVTEPVGPTLLAEEMRRRQAMVDAVAAPTADWTDEEGRMAAAMLDLLWSVPSYQRLVSAWSLDGQQATRAITWAIGVLADAIRAGRRPPPASEPTADSDQNPP
ncbi:TetR/AcrR family transcriptional regulator [Pseudofrankia sp. DC12]|uniref:TetR/AcrR family transcriptional regulator n=1 Tax=Pseudofrankia sp. DC12 TaxID=683315 RepID=UPI0005F88373|nr:TetR/AcrR family transcriptional regulator [Pseudofrankia sp. DC12]